MKLLIQFVGDCQHFSRSLGSQTSENVQLRNVISFKSFSVTSTRQSCWVGRWWKWAESLTRCDNEVEACCQFLLASESDCDESSNVKTRSRVIRLALMRRRQVELLAPSNVQTEQPLTQSGDCWRLTNSNCMGRNQRRSRTCRLLEQIATLSH